MKDKGGIYTVYHFVDSNNLRVRHPEKIDAAKKVH